MKYAILEGNYTRMGTQLIGEGVNFCFEGRKEQACFVILYERRNPKKTERIEVPTQFCVGSVRSVKIENLNWKRYDYNFEIDGRVMLDPYARRIVGREKWADKTRFDEEIPLRGGFDFEEFDWNNDCRPEIPRCDMFVYKLHVRGFSMEGRIPGKLRGTFAGVKEQVLYLKGLGVTTVEFMPFYEFEELIYEEPHKLPGYLKWEEKAGDKIKMQREAQDLPVKINYWGYLPGSYFAPKASYASDKNTSYELKTCIRTLHENNMECIMEIYFDRKINRNLILQALRFWVMEYHVDGFHLQGDALPIAQIVQDALLSRTKIFYTGFDRELLEKTKEYPHLFVDTDEFLYPARRLLNRQEGNLPDFLNQMKKQHEVCGYINYIAGNNGFTLADLFSYSEKHNEANGEENTDGPDWNFSSNCGLEGPTRKHHILDLRKKLMYNAAALVFLAQAVPMLLAGDERCNSQEGNNNAYCQDNKIGWVNWKNSKGSQEFEGYIRRLAAFRRAHPIIRREEPMQMQDYKAYGCPDLSYHGENAWLSDISQGRQAVGILYCGKYEDTKCKETGEYVYLGFNFYFGVQILALPKLSDGKKWYYVMDTKRKQPFLEEETEVKMQQILMQPQTVCILVGK